MWNGCHATTKHQVRREKSKFTIKSSKAYLRVKKAFSVSPEQAVAIAITKVVIPNVECIGTRLARKDAVADSQQRRSKKLKKPTMNWKSKMKWNVRHDAYFDDIIYNIINTNDLFYIRILPATQIDPLLLIPSKNEGYRN